ncbi:MAG: DUF2263 domain-containing protein [Nannocystaceae bacterium]
MSLKGIAKETVQICEAGEYVAPSGRIVSIREDLEDAVEGSLLYDRARRSRRRARAATPARGSRSPPRRPARPPVA